MIRSNPRVRNFRFRITAAFLVAALVISGFVAGATYGLARSYLTRQRVDSVLRQSYNQLRFASEYLARPQTADPQQLVTQLQARGTSDVLLTQGDETIASSLSVAREALPPGLIDASEQGEVGYASFGDAPVRLAFTSPVPGTPWTIYFVYPMGELEQTLTLLVRILAGVGALAAVGAGALGIRITGTVVAPLRQASEASRRVAEGLLDEPRLEERGDELGLLASSFNELAGALRQRIARERRFVANASHELRTPLTGLRASIDFLVDHGQDLPEQIRSTTRLAAQQVRLLQRMVDELLELSRLEAGSADVAEDEIELTEFVKQVVRRRGADAEIAIETDGDHLLVRTDKRRLEHVVGNLIENAVVHGMGEPVQVRIGWSGSSPAIAVIDRGPGISSEDLPHVFERFWRGERARRRSPSGSGLGLAIARENALSIGAALDVVSRPGETRFEVTLPATAYIGRRQDLEEAT